MLKTRTTTRETDTEDSRKAEIDYANTLPDELLLGIFLYLVQSEGGAVPILCRYHHTKPIQ